jgi:hypothetical protein
VYNDIPESSTRCCGTFHTPVPPPPPPMPSVSLKQLLALLNTIMQWLAAIDERQVGCSQYRQQMQDSSYLNFLSIYSRVH